MKKFTRHELIALGVIFLFLLTISIPNFALSIKRARDNSRKADMGNIVTAAGEYLEDFGHFPLSTTDGKILACKHPDEEVKYDAAGNLIINFIPCEWGRDGIFDYRQEPPFSYLSPLPDDPFWEKGLSYFYISNGKRYQIYSYLEAKDDDQFDENIIKRNLPCGTKICNSGRAYSNTPLDISLEEYEYKLYGEDK